VNGAAATVNVNFTSKVYHTFLVSFTETGFTGSWSLTVNGSSLMGSTATLTVDLGNGSYSWGVLTVPTGYTISPSAGSFTVTGSSVVVTLKAVANAPTTTTSSPAWTYLSTLAYVLIGVLALLVVIFLALALMAGRRPPSSPPESWSSSSSTTETKGPGNTGGSS
jgi:hypothetical protein